jgi:hypothetical protein
MNESLVDFPEPEWDKVVNRRLEVCVRVECTDGLLASAGMVNSTPLSMVFSLFSFSPSVDNLGVNESIESWLVTRDAIGANALLDRAAPWDCSYGWSCGWATGSTEELVAEGEKIMEAKIEPSYL